jgi:dephospho-CoA kinase
MSKTNLIGIGGLPRSGKDTLAEQFMKAGYFGVSFGDIVRDYCWERHKDKPDPISVANMTDTSNWLRETRGADVVLKEALRRFEEKVTAGEQYKGVVLYSIRAPIEVDFILARGGKLIWVESSDDMRHKRAMQHLRQGENEITLDEFRNQEALQWKPQPGIPEEVQMNVAYVKEHATDVLMNNSGSLEDFLAQANRLIEEIG